MTSDAREKTPNSNKRDIQKDPIIKENFSFYSTFLKCNVRTAYDGEKIKKGLRVLQKPKEKSLDAYGKKLVRIGSIFEVTNDGVLKVQWDSSSKSSEFRKEKNGQYDLLLFDNAQIEVKHTLVHCRGCGKHPLRGIRWECDGCLDYDLCTRCYMNNQHFSSGHLFKRIQSENAKGILMNRRSNEYNFANEIDQDSRVKKRKPKEDEEEHNGTVNKHIHKKRETFRSDRRAKWHNLDFGYHGGRGRQNYIEHMPKVSCDNRSIGLRVTKNEDHRFVGSVVNIYENPEKEETTEVESKSKLAVDATLKKKHTKTYDVQWDNGDYESYDSKDDSIRKWDDGPGTVTKLRDKKIEVFRSDARVKWNDSELSHPIGRDGICELKLNLKEIGRGKRYYHEHLPFVSSDTISIGLRVVQNHQKYDDGGHNFVGSVVNIYKIPEKVQEVKARAQWRTNACREKRANEKNKESEKKTIGKVGVRWDNGNYKLYTFTENLLRIWDNGPLGVEHHSYYCIECIKNERECKECIKGIRWHCEGCPDYDMCNNCYMNDEHDKSHKFQRVIAPTRRASTPISTFTRKKSKKSKAFGIFKDSKVHHLNQQINGENVGVVIEICDCIMDIGQCEVEVRWEKSMKTTRHDFLDLITNDCPKNPIHLDHLPTIGKDSRAFFEVDFGFVFEGRNIHNKISVNIWRNIEQEKKETFKPILYVIFAEHPLDKDDKTVKKDDKTERLFDEIMEFAKDTKLPCHVEGKEIMLYGGSSESVFIHYKTKKKVIQDLVLRGFRHFERGDVEKNEDQMHYFKRMAENVLGETVLPVIISLRKGGLRERVMRSATESKIPIIHLKKHAYDVTVLTPVRYVNHHKTSVKMFEHNTNVQNPWSIQTSKSKVYTLGRDDNEDYSNEISLISDCPAEHKDTLDVLVSCLIIGVSMASNSKKKGIYWKHIDMYSNALSMYLLKEGKWKIPKEHITKSFNQKSIEYIYEQSLNSMFSQGLWLDIEEETKMAYMHPVLKKLKDFTSHKNIWYLPNPDYMDSESDSDDECYNDMEVDDHDYVDDNDENGVDDVDRNDHTFIKVASAVKHARQVNFNKSYQLQGSNSKTAEHEQTILQKNLEYADADNDDQDEYDDNALYGESGRDNTGCNEGSEESSYRAVKFEETKRSQRIEEKEIELDISTSELYGLIFFALLRKQYWDGAKQLIETGFIRIQHILVGCVIIGTAAKNWRTAPLLKKKLKRLNKAFTQRAIRILSCIYEADKKEEKDISKKKQMKGTELIDTNRLDEIQLHEKDLTNHAGRLLLNHGYIEHAIKTENKTFLDNPEVKNIINKMWYGTERLNLKKIAFFIILACCHLIVMPLLMISLENRPFVWLYLQYKLPFMKVFINMIGFLSLLIAYAYMLLFDYSENGISYTDVFIITWMVSFFMDEIKQHIVAMKRGKWKSYSSDWWNRLDWLSMFVYTAGMLLKFGNHSPLRDASKLLLVVAFMLLCIRILNLFCMSEILGPKLVMIRKMFSDTFAFMIIMTVIMMCYNISFHALLYPNSVFNWSQMEKLTQNGYWMLFGELNLDGDILTEPVCTFNRTIYETGVLQQCPSQLGLYIAPYLKALYGLIAVILLLNLLIAMYSDTFHQVQQKSEFHWSQLQTNFLEEYSIKTIFPIHLQLLALPAFLVQAVIWYCICRRYTWYDMYDTDDYLTETHLNHSPMFVRVFLYNTNFDLKFKETKDAEENGALSARGEKDILETDRIEKLHTHLDSISIKLDQLQERKDQENQQLLIREKNIETQIKKMKKSMKKTLNEMNKSLCRIKETSAKSVRIMEETISDQEI